MWARGIPGICPPPLFPLRLRQLHGWCLRGAGDCPVGAAVSQSLRPGHAPNRPSAAHFPGIVSPRLEPCQQLHLLMCGWRRCEGETHQCHQVHMVFLFLLWVVLMILLLLCAGSSAGRGHSCLPLLHAPPPPHTAVLSSGLCPLCGLYPLSDHKPLE